MSVFRGSTGRNMLSASGALTRRSPMSFARYYTHTSSGAHTPPHERPQLAYASGQYSLESDPISRDLQTREKQLNYGAEVDQASSNFTPVPKRVMNGSESGHVIPAAIVSGAPVELQGRTARIYKPAKVATQSGDWHSHHWRMDWDILSRGHRWENPLMGWQSSADFMQGTHLNFNSKVDAIKFAEKQGYEYFVQEPNVRKISPKAYANNFMYTPGKLKHIRTK